ncbi:HTH-type transcriptional repressor KstR2 [Pseudoclavibacter triregionum]|nr:HTH-type transcriptional repressor KstR2 [Pseudoclavibacter triregionum]
MSNYEGHLPVGGRLGSVSMSARRPIAPAPRRGRPGYDQEAVVAAAVELFNRHGYDATSMGMLAERLGISKSAIYHHVPGKEQLLEVALERALAGLEAVLDHPAARDRSIDERLEFVLRATVGVLVDELPNVTLLLRLRGNTDMERQALERRRAFDRAITALVQEAEAEGVLRGDLDPRVVTRLVFGMINSITEWYKPDGPLRREELGDSIVALVMGGLRPRSDRS